METARQTGEGNKLPCNASLPVAVSAILLPPLPFHTLVFIFLKKTFLFLFPRPHHHRGRRFHLLIAEWGGGGEERGWLFPVRVSKGDEGKGREGKRISLDMSWVANERVGNAGEGVECVRSSSQFRRRTPPRLVCLITRTGVDLFLRLISFSPCFYVCTNWLAG